LRPSGQPDSAAPERQSQRSQRRSIDPLSVHHAAAGWIQLHDVSLAVRRNAIGQALR
jgi:hypothetical protein